VTLADPPASKTGAETSTGDAALVAALRRGEPAAFEQLVRAHGGRLLAVARRFLRDEEDARDAVQEAFLAAFKAIDRFEGEARISTWLHRIVVNASLMRLRQRSRHPEESIEELLPRFLEDGHHTVHPREWVDSAHGLLERDEVRTLVRRSVDALPDTYRTVLLLRDVEERDTAEVAVALGISAGAVKTRLHRARQALRALLDPELRKGHA
jgi:RNA polymerase sigma-70 factor (ECF subfamily)